METTRNAWNNKLFLTILNMIALGLLLFVSDLGSEVHAAPVKVRMVRVWLQTMDSCQQAIPGASFTLNGNGLSIAKGPAPGAEPRTLASILGKCPLQHGNCVITRVGCLWWSIPAPASGTVVYTITETSPAPGYADCLGGSDCAHGPNVLTLTVDSTGAVSGTDLNIFPNGDRVRYPTNRPAFLGTQVDPLLVHNSHLGNGNCDGDNDADDHTTGTEGMKKTCDSEAAKNGQPG